MKRPSLTFLLTLGATFPASAVGDAPARLEPYQIVRSLELVQDRLAGGDHASQPMQRKLLEMVDARFATREGARFEDERNRRALLVYAMSGGNPATVEAALAYLGKDDPNRKLGEKVLFYVNGKPKEAMDAFASVDPMSYPPDVAMYAALIKGSLMSAGEPAPALALLDRARLLGPGTLVEEAALRRSLPAAVALGDAKRFLRLSEQYVRAYLRSPYASQFADALVAGVVALHENIDRRALGEIVGLMDAEQEKTIYLRIARRAAIDGTLELAAFAATQAESVADDPRARLYSSLSTVTSDEVADVLNRLSQVDRDQLSDNDRRLLDAANAIAAGLTVSPAEMQKPSGANPAGPAQADHNAGTPGATVAASPQPSRNRGPSKAVDVTVEQAAAKVAATRAKLADIDKLIGAMPE